MTLNGRPSPTDRRTDSRETARLTNGAAAPRARTRRRPRRGGTGGDGTGAALLAVAAIVAIIIALAVRPATLGPRNMASDGVLLGANAAACVADSTPNSYLAVNSALFAAQPEEQGTDLTDTELLTVLHSAGVRSPAVTDCVREQTFASWVENATDRTLAVTLDLDADEIALTAAQSAAAATAEIKAAAEAAAPPVTE